MKPERNRQIDEVFQAALARDAAARPVFLDEACAGDPVLRGHVEALLASDESAGSFIEQPAYERGAELLRDWTDGDFVGRTLSHYRLVRQLGAGGMGVVYLAEDTQLGRRAAVKILPRHLADDASLVSRFRQEARAASALNHPNIVTIYEVGEAEGTHFIATELVEGATLRERMARAPVTVGEAVDIALQVAAALWKAHAAGVVHRDVKPENVMLNEDGHAKVLDFGIAKLVEHARASATEAPTVLKVQTSPGAVMGTAHYMSPEQARALIDVDARTDIFSLGVVLYEMLAGRQPFEGETATDVMASILTNEPPPLARYNREVSEALDLVVQKALAKDREERYQMAKELLSDLRRVKQRLEAGTTAGFDDRTAADANESHATCLPAADTHRAGGARTDEAAQIHTTSSAEYVANEIKRHKRGFIVGLAILVLATIGLGYWFLASRSADAAQIESIAVLPFANQNPETEYLSDGLTESIINNLARLPSLRVITRNSVFRYKGKETEPATVGQELNVRAVLTGRVVQRGDNLIISTELTDLRDNKQIWGQQYNRKVTDAFALQQEISRDISETLRSKLSGEEQQRLAKRETVSPEAYQLYLRGRYHWNKRENKEFIKALEYFQQAIDKDPTYALAYVGLADSYLLGGYNSLSRREKVTEAQAAAQKALEIDETIGEAHNTLANIKHWNDWDWAGAEREYKRAIELSPNYATGHHWYAESLSAVGRFEESFAEYKRALELDPLSLAISTDLGLAFYYSRQYDRAIEHLKKLIETEPNYMRTHFYLALIYEEKGMFEEALAEYEKGNLLEGENMEEFAKGKAKVEEALRVSGAKGYWQQILNTSKESARKAGRPFCGNKYHQERASNLCGLNPVEIANLHARLGERDKAFELLVKAYEERNTDLVWLKVSPILDNLRGDPRLADLMRQVGLPQ